MLAHILWRLIPTPPHSLTCSPVHGHRALGQRAPKPTIRSWLGGGGPPPTKTPHWTLDLTLDWTWDIVLLVGPSVPLTASDRRQTHCTHRYSPTRGVVLHPPPHRKDTLCRRNSPMPSVSTT